MSSNSADTRSRLLAAAREEFTDHGLEGARVDRIAARAGVNKERIYGHFGSKDRLFEAVIAAALDEHVAALGLPTADLADYVGRIYDFHAAHPHLLRLMQWESLSYGDRRPPDAERRAAHYVDKVAALATALDAPPDRETAATLILLIGLAAWPHTLPRLTRLILGPDTDAETMHSVLRKSVVEFARRALQPALSRS
jgi:AcrR family transcriptional regulator